MILVRSGTGAALASLRRLPSDLMDACIARPPYRRRHYDSLLRRQKESAR